MVVYTGYQAYAMIGSESAYGVPGTANKDVGLIDSMTITEKNDFAKIHTLSQRDIATSSIGKYEVSGDFNFAYQHGRMFHYVFAATSHASSSTDWAHKFDTPSNTAPLPSFTVEGGVDATSDIVYKISGAKAGGTTLSMDVDGHLTQKVDFIAQSMTTATSATTFTGSSLPIYTAYSALVQTAGGVKTNVKSFELTVANNLEAVYTLGNRTCNSLVEKNREYTFKMSLAFDSETEHAAFLAGSGGGTMPTATQPLQQNITFQVSNGTAYGSGKKGLTMVLAGCHYDASSTPFKTTDVIYQDIDGFATTLNNCTAWDNIASTSWA